MALWGLLYKPNVMEKKNTPLQIICKISQIIFDLSFSALCLWAILNLKDILLTAINSFE